MPIDPATPGRTNPFYAIERHNSEIRTQQGDKTGALTQGIQDRYARKLAEKPGLHSENQSQQVFCLAVVNMLTLVSNAAISCPAISPASGIAGPATHSQVYTSTSPVQHVAALTSAGLLKSSEPTQHPHRIMNPLSSPAGGQVRPSPRNDKEALVGREAQAGLQPLTYFIPGTNEYFDVLSRVPTKSVALPGPGGQNDLENVKVFELRIAEKESGAASAGSLPFYLSLKDGYFYRVRHADSMGEGPYALQRGSTDTLVWVGSHRVRALSNEEKKYLLTAAGVPGPHEALFDSGNAVTRKPLPPVLNQLWIGEKKIPRKVLRIVSANHHKIARAPSALKHIVYLSSQNVEAFKHNKMALQRAAPGAEIIELETSPFMTSFQQWRGGVYAQLAREHERLANLGGFGPAFRKDILMLGLLATHDTDWAGGGLYLDLDSLIVGAFTPENLSAPPDTPLVGRLAKSPKLGDSTFICNDALGVHANDPFPENVLALAIRNLNASPVPPMDDRVKASETAKSDYFSRLAKTSGGPELFTETLLTTPITGSLLQFAVMPYRTGVMPEDEERNRFFNVPAFVETSDGGNDSWG